MPFVAEEPIDAEFEVVTPPRREWTAEELETALRELKARHKARLAFELGSSTFGDVGRWAVRMVVKVGRWLALFLVLSIAAGWALKLLNVLR